MSIDISEFINEAKTQSQFWDCPYCKKSIQINEQNFKTMSLEKSKGLMTIIMGILCPNPHCQKVTTYLSFYSNMYLGPRIAKSVSVEPLMLHAERLYPHGIYIHYPDYIPEPIIKDYEEAACIVDLSPKASAALIRRALQGMIKDKWPLIKDDLLYNQIEKLQSLVPKLEFEALHAIRLIGNVGVHMKNPGAIADNDSPITSIDATNLINLLEYLLKTWYVDVNDAAVLMSNIAKRGNEIDSIQKGKN